MGVCSYGGGTIPAHSKQFCEDNNGVWSEGTAEDSNPLIGKDFTSAIGETFSNWSGKDDANKENLGGYVKRRWDEDPYSLAFDAAMMYGGGSLARAALSKIGFGKLLKNSIRKKTIKTKKVPPEIDPITKRIKKGSKWGTIEKTVRRPRLWPTAVVGGGLYQADKAGFSTPWNDPFSAQGKENRLAMQQKALETSKAGIDAVNKKKEEEETKKAAEIEAQNKIDNMSFFDKWKLGMKDPTTAALFGAGLRDIGSNIPGQNQLGEMQTDYATAAASGGPDAADFNAQKVDKETLMNLFRSKKPFLIGDSKEERDKKASAKVAKYYAVRAQMFTKGWPTDHDSIMAMLEKLGY
jgi:hypothetical protein